MPRLPSKSDCVLLVLAALALPTAVCLHGRAHPTVRFDEALGQDDALARAQQWLALAGHNTAGYRTAIVFDHDRWTRRYFEERFDTGGAAVWGTGPCADVWRWYVRFFLPHEPREFRVTTNPVGGLIELHCALSDVEPGLNMTAARAKPIADAFARRAAPRLGPHYKLERHYLTRRPRRRDYGFQWERPLKSFDSARVRMKIMVSSDKVVHFKRDLVVPEAFKHKFTQRRAHSAAVAAVVTQATHALALVAGLYWLLFSNAHRRTRLGILALAACVLSLALVCELFNSLQWTLFACDTTTGPSLFIAQRAVSGLRWDLARHVTALLAAACALHYWPRGDPPTPQLLSQRGSSLQAAAAAGWRGVLIAGSLIGLSALAAVAAQEWLYARAALQASPNGICFEPVPALALASHAANSALRSELVFRVFALMVFVRVCRSRVAAVLMAALLWGAAALGHESHPPAVTLIAQSLEGALLCWAVLRYDVLTAMVASYLLACVPHAIPLFMSGSAYVIANAAAALALPLVPAVVLGLMRGRRLVRGRDAWIAFDALSPSQVSVVCRSAPRRVDLEQQCLALMAGHGTVSLVALAAQHPVALAIASIASDGRAQVDLLYVSPACRRRGVGSQLLSEVVSRVTAMGATQAAVEGDPRDLRSVAFLAANGFHQTGATFTRALDAPPSHQRT